MIRLIAALEEFLSVRATSKDAVDLSIAAGLALAKLREVADQVEMGKDGASPRSTR